MTAIEKPLTETNVKALNALVTFTRKHNRPPTRRELAFALGCSVGAANWQLWALAKKGRIRVLDGTHRGIEIIEDAA